MKSFFQPYNWLQFAILSFSVFLFNPVHAQIDFSFGGANDGAAKIQYGSTGEKGYRSVIDPSTGKIYINVVTDDDPDEASSSRTFIYRLNADGTMDTGFGPVIFDTPMATDVGYGMAIQPDGKIVVAGQSLYSATVWRINPNGSFDNSFGQNGKAVLNNEFGIFRSVAIQSNGRIVAAGMGSVENSKFSYLVARFMPNGTLDPSFASGGYLEHRVASTSVMEDWGAGWGLALQPNDGKIVVCGFEESSSGTGQNGTILRITTNGALDNTFSDNGVWTTQGMTGVQYLYDVKVVGSDQRIVVCGMIGNNSDRESMVIRLLNNGAFDNSFAGSGIYLNDFASGYLDSYYGLAVQADGKYLISGRSGGKASIFRLKTNGQIDPAFDGDGILLYSLGNSPDYYYGQIFNGCFYVAGNYTTNISFLDTEAFVGKICLGNIVSTDDLDSNSPEVSIYPNPVHDILSIQISEYADEVTSIILTDHLGRLIFSNDQFYPNGSTFHCDIALLPPGAYYLQVANKRGRRVLPVVKI